MRRLMFVACAVFILLLTGCSTPRPGASHLYQGGAAVGVHKVLEKRIPAVVQTDNGGMANVAFPWTVVPHVSFYHTARSHGHPENDGRFPARVVWVVGGITEVFIED